MKLLKWFDEHGSKINWGASFLDGDAIADLNEAFIEARKEPIPTVCGMTIDQAEKCIYQLETENEKEYVGRGADAYNHCCDDLEGWQEERSKKGLDTGPVGTLTGWMNWAQEKMDGEDFENE